ncbi:MAG: hypothetical protein HC841_00330 [Verrucomicrobiae bacterium]|nr:hypothetical protein [Verrucomicrobiae bacterium]
MTELLAWEDPTDVSRIEDAVLAYENTISDRTRQRPSRDRPSGGLFVMLLEPIDSFGFGEAVVLEPVDSGEVKILTITGEVIDDGEGVYGQINVKFNEQGASYGTRPVDFIGGTAEAMLANLHTIDGLAPGTVRCGGGYMKVHRTGEDVQCGRYFVHLQERAGGKVWPSMSMCGNLSSDFSNGYVEEILRGQHLSLLSANNFIAFPTETRVTVQSLLPMGFPNPQVAGALALVQRVNGFGWVIHGLEPRYLRVLLDD